MSRSRSRTKSRTKSTGRGRGRGGGRKWEWEKSRCGGWGWHCKGIVKSVLLLCCRRRRGKSVAHSSFKLCRSKRLHLLGRKGSRRCMGMGMGRCGSRSSIGSV